MGESERRAIERLSDACSERAWRLAVAFLRNSHDASDAVQQAFLVAARKVKQIPSGDPWPWFSVVVGFEARNMARKRNALPADFGVGGSMDEPSDTPLNDPAQFVASKESIEELESALNGLPANEREAITLTRIGGMSHEDAARVLGMPRKTLTSHVLRGVQRLRGRLRVSDSGLAGMLAVLPVPQPPGGMAVAAAGWQAAAVSSLGVGGAGLAAATGGLVMIKKSVAAAGMAIALGLGAAGGFVAGGGVETHEPKDSLSGTASTESNDAGSTAGERTTATKADNPLETDRPAARSGLDEGEARALRGKLMDAEQAKLAADGELSRLSQELDELRIERDALLAELAPYREQAAERAPVFTFGAGGKLDGVLQADWGEISAASMSSMRAMLAIYTARLAGEQPAREHFLQLQENVEKVRKYEYRTIGAIETFARHNGELTHPISLANLVALMLKQAGDPLSEAQVGRITALGLQWEQGDASRRRLYGPDTPRVRKMVEEFDSKCEFVDAMFRELSQAQREIVIIPEIHQRASLDLLCPTLMMIHTSPIVTGASREEILGKLQNVLKGQYRLEDGQLAQVEPLLAQFMTDCGAALEPVTKPMERHYTRDQAGVFGRASATLVESLLASANLTEEQRARVLDDYGWFVPRVVVGG